MSFGLGVLAFAAALIASAGMAAADISRTVAQILDQFGWDTEEVGVVEAARAIEWLCKLWCILGIGKIDWWPHAFKLLRGLQACG